MSGPTFDTLKFAETLREAGIPESQAKAISMAVRGAHDTAEITTKPDLRELASEVRTDMQTLRSEMQSDMQLLRADLRSDIQRLDAKIDRLEPQLTVRLGGLVVVALGAFTALSKWIG